MRLRLGTVPLAIALLIVLPANVLALTWAPAVKLTTSRNGHADGGLLVTSEAVHVAYEEANGGILRTWVRRSTDGGATWSTRIRLSRSAAPLAFGASIAGVGSALAAVWTEQTTTGAYVVVYSGSTDGGATWSTRRVLSPSTGDAGLARVARDGGGRIAVVWTDNTSGAVRVRTSLDGGSTWAGSITLVVSTNAVAEGMIEGYPDIAFGSTSWYVAYLSAPGTIKLRRSTTTGESWASASTMTTQAWQYGLDVAARGANAIVAYARLTVSDVYSAYRRTTDSGAVWSAESALAVTTAPYSFVPHVDISGGRWRAVYEQCATDECLKSKSLYRDSANGTSWSSPETASGTARPFNPPAGVGSAGSVFVLSNSYHADLDDEDVVIRVGS